MEWNILRPAFRDQCVETGRQIDSEAVSDDKMAFVTLNIGDRAFGDPRLPTAVIEIKPCGNRAADAKLEPRLVAGADRYQRQSQQQSKEVAAHRQCVTNVIMSNHTRSTGSLR